MNLTPQALAKEVATTGFGAEPLEKVFRLRKYGVRPFHISYPKKGSCTGGSGTGTTGALWVMVLARRV